MGTIAETIFLLGLRQSLSIKRAAVLLLISAVPLAIVMIGIATNTEWDSEDLQYLVQIFIINTTLPLNALIIGAPVFADEIEDRTLTNLMLSPIARWRIALPKVAAATVVTAAPMVVTGFIAVLLMLDVDSYTGAVVAAFGILVGAIAFVSLFSFVGTLTTKAVIFGIIYVFGFEVLIASAIPGLRYISIGGMTLSLMQQLHSDLIEAPISGAGQLPPTLYSIVGLAVVIVGCNLLTIWRLRRMDVH